MSCSPMLVLLIESPDVTAATSVSMTLNVECDNSDPAPSISVGVYFTVWFDSNTSRADEAVISGWVFCLVGLDCPVHSLNIPRASWVLDKRLIIDPIQKGCMDPGLCRRTLSISLSNEKHTQQKPHITLSSYSLHISQVLVQLFILTLSTRIRQHN